MIFNKDRSGIKCAPEGLNAIKQKIKPWESYDPSYPSLAMVIY